MEGAGEDSLDGMSLDLEFAGVKFADVYVFLDNLAEDQVDPEDSQSPAVDATKPEPKREQKKPKAAPSERRQQHTLQRKPRHLRID